VLEQRGRVQGHAEKLTDLPIVGDVRGAGYFYGIEMVKDKDTKETFDDDEAERLLRGFLSGALFEAGLICRADDRGDPVIQLAPPLIIGQPEFDFIEQTLRSVLTEAWMGAAKATHGKGAGCHDAVAAPAHRVVRQSKRRVAR
jgi:adenosylmethionine-8-amino-7-oxononanoate aminotransferase